jgi:hypothetical protein
MREMRFHGFRGKIDFFGLLRLVLAVLPAPSSSSSLVVSFKALISQEFLCDGEVENHSKNVAEHAGNKIPYGSYRNKGKHLNFST